MSETEDGRLAEHLRRGRRGERIAADYLRDKGWSIEAMNFETKHGELDIVARRPVRRPEGHLVAFVEVKTRSSPGAMGPELAVTARKRSIITSMAEIYVQRYDRANTGYRFDVIGVDLSEESPTIDHFEAAFDVRGNPF